MAVDIYAQDPRKVRGILNGRAYNYGGDVLGSSKGYKIGQTYRGLPKTGNYKGTSGYSTAALDEAIRSTQSEIAAIRAQTAAMPRLPDFDYSAAMSRAGKRAASTVNPVYADKLKRYLTKQRTLRKQETVTRTRNKEDIATALSQTLEDTLLSRGRVTEDTENKVGDITANENSYQYQEGRQFDQARSALLGDVANAGLTESGIGQGQVADVTKDRNLASDDQVRQFATAKRDTEIFKTRTLADLDTTDVREKGGAKRKTKDENIALRSFIDNQNLDIREKKADLETERTLAINSAQESAYNKIVAKTIAALAGSGARSQDIALFKQVYG